MFIINTNFFTFDGKVTNQERRIAAGKDSENLKFVFTETLGFKMIGEQPLFDVRLHEFDKREQNMSWVERPFWEHLKKEENCDCITCKLRQSEGDFKNCECFVLAISSHGTRELLDGYMEQRIMLSDTYLLPLRRIIDVLSDASCPSLKGVPRVILLDVCRTDQDFPNGREDLKVDKGQVLTVQRQAEQLGSLTLQDTSDSARANRPEDKVDVEYVFQYPEITVQELPENFIIVFPSYINKQSYHDKDEGSWMIAELKNAIENHNLEAKKEIDLLQLLTEVSRRVANREGQRGQKQAFTVYHRLLEPVRLTKYHVPQQEPVPALVTTGSSA